MDLSENLPDGLSRARLSGSPRPFDLSENQTVTSATLTEVEPRTLVEEQAQLRAQLARSRRSLRLQMALEFALDLVSGLVLAGLVLVVLDYWLRLGLSSRQVLLAVSLLGLMIGLAIRSRPRVRASRLDDLALAMTLDCYRPGTGQQVADVLQLPGQLSEARSSASPALIHLAVRRASESLAEANWRAHWNRGRTATRTLGLLGVILVPVAFATLAPAAARLSVARWLKGSSERWPQKTYLSVVGLEDRSRLLAPRNEPFVVEVQADAHAAEPHNARSTIAERGKPGWAGWFVPGRGEPLLIRNPSTTRLTPDAVQLRERTSEGAVRTSVMSAIGPSRFRQELPPSASTTTFDLSGGDDWLGPIRVERVDRPSLEPVKLRVRDSGASEGAFRAIEDTRQHLIFLPETEIELTLTGNEALAKARVDVHPGTPPELVRVDPKSFVARWILREATTLEIQITSKATGLDSKPTFLSLGLLKDREPRVSLRAQGVGAHVTPIATIPLTIAATDDLGLASIRIQVERTIAGAEKAEPITTKQTIPISLATEGGRAILDHQARHDVDLQAASPPIGAVLRLQGEADDRSARGAQVGRSGVIHIQVVSADDLFYEILIRQRAERAKFLAALGATEKLGPSLASTPTPEDYTAASRALHTGTRQLELIAGSNQRLARRDEAEPGRVAQVAPLAPGWSDRPDPRAQHRDRRRVSRCSARAGQWWSEIGDRTRESATTACGGRRPDENDPRPDVAVGKLRRRRESGRRGHQDPAKCAQGDRESPRLTHPGGFR